MSPTPPKRNLKRVHELVAALYSDNPKVMRQAAKALDGMGAEVMPSHIPDLTKALNHPETEARYGVLCAFCKLGPHLLFEKRVARQMDPAIPALIRIIKDPDEKKDTRLYAMRILAYAGRPAPEAVAPLTRLLKDEDKWIREAALATLASIGKEGRAAFVREFRKRPAEIADKLPSTHSLLAWAVIAKDIAPLLKDKDPAVVKATMSLLDELVEADELPRGVKYDRTALHIREEKRAREGKQPAKQAKTVKKKVAKKRTDETSAPPPASEPWKVVQWAVRESLTIPEGLDAFADVMGSQVPAELMAIPRAGWKEDLKRLTEHVEKGLKRKPKDSVNVFTFLISWPMHHVDVKWNGSSGFSPDDPESYCAPHFEPTPAWPRLQVLRAIDHYERKEKPGNDWADSVNCLIVGLLLKEVCKKLWKRLASPTGEVRYVEYGYPDGETLLGEITAEGFTVR